MPQLTLPPDNDSIKIMIEEHIRTWYTIKKEDLAEDEFIDKDGDLSDSLMEAIYSKSFEAAGEKYHSDIHIIQDGE